MDPRSLETRSPLIAPWSSDHLVGLIVANGIGAVLVFVGWWESSGLGSAHRQLAWLNLGVLGLIIAGGANGLWLARSRRVIMLARALVLPHPGAGLLPHPVGPTGNGRSPSGVEPGVLQQPARRGSRAARAAGLADAFVAGRAMSFYHRADCLLVSGKEVKVAGRAEHERAALRACEVCLP